MKLKNMKLKESLKILFASFLFTSGLLLILSFLRIPLRFPGATPFMFLLVSILILFLYKFFEKKPWKEYGLQKLKKKDFLFSMYFLFLLFPIAFLGRILDPGFDAWYAQQSNLFTFSGLLLSLLLMPLFVIKEEIFERSLIQSKISKHYGSVITGIAVSVNFAFMHFYITQDMQHVAATVISVFFGSFVLVFLYEATHNIFATIFTHLLYNLLVVIQIYLHVKEYFVFEIIFWIVFGILFFLTFKYCWAEIKKMIMQKKTVLSFFDWVFLIVFSALPLLLYFFL